MVYLSPRVPNSTTIKNIIFDFGGVICNIDVKLTEKRFREMGLKAFDPNYSVADSAGLFELIENGKITADEFRQQLKKYFSHPVTNEQLDEAWNALLLDIPEPRIRLLEKLQKNYRIFLLSNSNEIHYRKYLDDFRRKYGYHDFNALFEKAYFSFQIGLKKPGLEVFEFVLRNNQLTASETLFIDDSIQHVEGARKAGINAYHLKITEDEQILDLFQPEK